MSYMIALWISVSNESVKVFCLLVSSSYLGIVKAESWDLERVDAGLTFMDSVAVV